MIALMREDDESSSESVSVEVEALVEGICTGFVDEAFVFDRRLIKAL